MRLVSGLQKGRRLKQPGSSAVRPTSSKVREALFAILHDRVDQASVLDLYAGTGALGLEALSRGAQHVVFVDHAPESLNILRENILRCAVQDQSRVIGQEVKRFLRSWSKDHHTDTFDLILVDPPYHLEEAAAVLQLLGTMPILSSAGILAIEHFTKHQLASQAGTLTRYRQARYGDTTVSFYSEDTAPRVLPCGIGVYPGTFDPITLGHTDIVMRSLRVFDHLIVAIAPNTRKEPVLPLQGSGRTGSTRHERPPEC